MGRMYVLAGEYWIFVLQNDVVEVCCEKMRIMLACCEVDDDENAREDSGQFVRFVLMSG